MQETNGRRLFTFLVSFGLAALLVVLVLALDTFGGSGPELPPVAQNVDTATGYLILSSIVIMLWGTSTFYRCTDSFVKRRYIAIDVLLLLWILAAIVCETSSGPVIVRYFQYAFSIPLAFIPVLMFSSALHITALDYRPVYRVLRWIALGVSCLIVVLAFTNDLHGAYFPVDSAPSARINPTPTPLQAALLGWGTTVLLFTAFLVLAASRWRVRVVVGIALILVAVVALLVLIYVFDARSLLDNNIPLAYVLLIIIITEMCLHVGVVGSYAGFPNLFVKLPFDLKLLTPDRDLLFRTQFKTDVATPLRAEEKERLVKLSPLQEKAAEFRIPSIANRMYRAYTIPGGIVLFSADSTALSAQTNRLEERQEMLEQQVAFLEQRNSLQQLLRRQERERELFEDIEESLRTATTTIQTIIASLPAADTPESRERRRQQLVLVKLLVAYCKRKGSLVLASKGGADFDRDRLMVIINEMVTDLRTAGAECAAIIEVDTPLSSYAVNQLYDCLYDFVTIAFQHAEPLIMVFVQTSNDGTVHLRAQLEDSEGLSQMQNLLSDQLVDRLAVGGIEHDFDRDESSMRLVVTLPVEEG